ncbi:MAG: branched-chain amino acid ABC transporter permease [Rhodospirillaceae bacterium]|nr:branched-chain amino acid ABC transporter permease [Rhodospirillaceae bacterium]
MFGAYVDGVVIAAGINALLALGLYWTVSTGQFSVGHGGFMAIGAYVSSILTLNFGVPLVPAMLAGGACAFVVGGLIGLPVMRFDMIYLAMATLGFGEIVRSLLSTIDYVGGVAGMRGMSGVTLWHVLVTLAIVLVLAWLHDRSRLGMAYSAVRQDADAALAMGIDVRRVKVGAFAIGAGITGIAGALYAHQMLFIDPETFGFPMSIAIVLFVIFGGLGIFWGPVLGAIVLTVLPELLQFIKDWYLFLYGAIYVVMMIWRPQGVVDRRMVNRIGRWLRLRPAPAPGA